MMRPMKRGLGFAGGAMTAGGTVPMPDRGGGGYAEEMPYEGGGSADELAEETPAVGGDGWSDLQRSLRDEVESSVDGPDLYEDQEAWLAKWRARAQEMGLSDEEAMAVLDSIADLDGGYGSSGEM